MANLIRGLSENGGVVFCGVDSTELVRCAEQLHTTSATCSAALGRPSSAFTNPRGSDAALEKSLAAPPRAPKPKRFSATRAPCGSRAMAGTHD